ncbi:hypothetical protein Tco_0886493 [Tanacetum coccineum]
MFLHNSSSNFPEPILGFGNKVYNSTSDRRKVEGAMYRVTKLVLGCVVFLERNLGKGFLKFESRKLSALKGLTLRNFGALHEGTALQNLDQFCHVSFEKDDRRFTSQAWNMLFRIKEQVVREHVMEFLSSFNFRDHIETLDQTDTMVFQLGGGKEEYDHEIVHSGSWDAYTSGDE